MFCPVNCFILAVMNWTMNCAMALAQLLFYFFWSYLAHLFCDFWLCHDEIYPPICQSLVYPAFDIQRRLCVVDCSLLEIEVRLIDKAWHSYQWKFDMLAPLKDACWNCYTSIQDVCITQHLGFPGTYTRIPFVDNWVISQNLDKRLSRVSLSEHRDFSQNQDGGCRWVLLGYPGWT